MAADKLFQFRRQGRQPLAFDPLENLPKGLGLGFRGWLIPHPQQRLAEEAGRGQPLRIARLASRLGGPGGHPA